MLLVCEKRIEEKQKRNTREVDLTQKETPETHECLGALLPQVYSIRSGKSSGRHILGYYWPIETFTSIGTAGYSVSIYRVA